MRIGVPTGRKYHQRALFGQSASDGAVRGDGAVRVGSCGRPTSKPFMRRDAIMHPHTANYLCMERPPGVNGNEDPVVATYTRSPDLTDNIVIGRRQDGTFRKARPRECKPGDRPRSELWPRNATRTAIANRDRVDGGASQRVQQHAAEQSAIDVQPDCPRAGGRRSTRRVDNPPIRGIAATSSNNRTYKGCRLADPAGSHKKPACDARRRDFRSIRRRLRESSD